MATVFDAPEGVPARLVAGDTWAWTRCDIGEAHDPTLYTLGFTFTPVAGGSPVPIAAPAVDGVFSVEVAAIVTATFTPGTWAWTATLTRISDGARAKFDDGTVVVLPDPATSTADTRSHARKVLDSIEALIEGRAAKDVEEYTIEGRSLTKMPLDDLMRLRATYRRMVAAEAGRSPIAYRRFDVR